MDISTSPEVVAGGLLGGGGLIGFLRCFYKDWQLDRRLEKIEGEAAEARASIAELPTLVGEKLEKLATTIEGRLDKQDEEIASHALLDAQTFVTKAEHKNLVDHIDEGFTELRKLIIDLIKDGAGKRRGRGGT